MDESFRSYVRQELKKDNPEFEWPEDAGRHHPLQSVIEDWFARHDEFRERRKLEKQRADSAFRERMIPIKLAKRRSDDAARKRDKRRADAAAEGRVILGRTNLSSMDADERAKHRKRVAREKKQRQRQRQRLATSPNFGLF